MSVSTNYVTVDDNSDYRAENIPRANNPNNPGSPRRYRGRRHQGYRNHIGRSTQCDRQASDHQNSHTAPPTLEELERIASTVVQNRLIPDSQKFHAVNMRAEEIPSGNIDNICSDCIDFMAKLIPEPELVVAAPASDGTTNKNSEDVRQTITLTDQHRHQLVENFLRSLELQASDVCHLDSFISESCGEIRNNIISALPANVVVDIAQMCRRPDLMKKSFGSDVYASLLSKGMIIDYGNPSTEKDWWSPLLKYTDETHGEMMIRNVPDGCENCHCFLRDIDRKYQTRTSKNITDFISNKCSLGSYQGLQDPDGHSEKIDGLHGDEINCKASPSSTTTNVDWAVYESKSASEESEGGPVSDSDEEEGNTSSGTKDESKESGDEARTESGVKKEDDNLSTASTIPFIEINDERKETIIEREGSTIKDDNLSVEDNDRKDKSQYMTLFDTGNNRWKSLSKYGQAVTCLSICKHVNGCPIRKINAERFRSAVDVKFNEVNRQSSDHAIPEDAMDVQLSWRLEMKPKHILAFSSNADMLSATLTASSSNTNIDNVSGLLVEEQLPANLSLVIADGITRPSVTSRLCIHTVISASMQVPQSEGAFQSENGMRFSRTWRNVLPATYTGIPITDDTVNWRSIMYTQTTKDEILRIARFSPVEIVPSSLLDIKSESSMLYNHGGRGIDMKMVGLTVQRYRGGEPGIYWIEEREISRSNRKKVRMELDMALEERKTHLADMTKRAKYVTEKMFGEAVNQHNENIRNREKIINGGNVKNPSELNEANDEVVRSDKVITNLAIHTHILNQQSRQLKVDLARLTNNVRSSSLIF